MAQSHHGSVAIETDAGKSASPHRTPLCRARGHIKHMTTTDTGHGMFDLGIIEVQSHGERCICCGGGGLTIWLRSARLRCRTMAFHSKGELFVR